MNRSERARAEHVSAVLDDLIDHPKADLPLSGRGLSPEDVALLAPARRLARLPALLGPVDPALEQRVLRAAEHAGERRIALLAQEPRWRPARLGWAAAALAAMLLLVFLVTPLDEKAMASFLSVFNLGHTDVQVAHVATPEMPAAEALQATWTLAEARDTFSFPLPEPAYLPPGYTMQVVHSYTYPDLPAWVPQPLSAELVYSHGPHTLSLLVYPIMLGNQATIRGIDLEATTVRDTQDVDVNGHPGVLMHLGTWWSEVVWEDGELILAVRSTDLPEAELLRVARSVGQ
ncbi:MAG: DUF4367 domain-containing protein [Anaerolineae bacterium]|nr:DUF4367 domain-containing protein [Anaerolineae bacterium]